ncbi:MAG TPA: nitroreductase [Prolixibacteraceae bacterium]|nr:nitroreductase [Prolixibacteraceae bacterium]
MDSYSFLRQLVSANRSYRRFDESASLDHNLIRSWIDLARHSPSGRNMQPLKYVICADRKTNTLIFGHLAWAGYLKEWPGPQEGERPAAYIAVLKDKTLAENIFCDDGIAMQSILLGAVSSGFGGCIIGSFNKSKIRYVLDIPDHLDILYMVALGKPAETVVTEDLAGEDIRYWRDSQSIHHVPKRTLDELIIKEI